MKTEYYTVKNKIEALAKCKELVLKNMRDEYCLIEYWDGQLCNVTPEEHFNNIVNWCKNHIKSTIWSCQRSAKSLFYTSYGAKHECERKLKCYVANNWMKVAMIYAGLEIVNDDCEDSTGYVCKQPVILSELLDNSKNFIVRVPRKKIDLDKMICDYTKPLIYKR